MVSICVIGLWHLGCVTAACLARNHKVVGYDRDKKTIEALNKGQPPIAEPGLAEAIQYAAKKGKLSFTSDQKLATGGAEVFYIAIDTPVNEKDEVDISLVEGALEALLPSLKESSLVIISSQVPVGTSRALLLRMRKAGKNAVLCYSPENLRLGSALEAFLKPERLVLGVSDPSAKPFLEKVFEGVSGERLYMDLESAEMAKHAMNAYLATMISFSGEVSDLCEKTGANAILVMDSLRKEKRVSSQAPISPGLGFGGGTLARDVQVMRRIGGQNGLKTPLLDSVLEVNRARMGLVQRKLKDALGNLSGKTITFLGLTYKSGTDTLRRSLALDIISDLKKHGAKFRAYDPAIKKPIGGFPEITVCGSAEEAAKGADALVITTAWEEFSGLDYNSICPLMRKPVIIDARNIVEHEHLSGKIAYFGIGVTHGSKN